MLKLYKISGMVKEYWETWEEDAGGHRIHWGELGTAGQSKLIETTALQKAEDTIQEEIGELISKGFKPVLEEDHAILMIEYQVEGMGSNGDLSKRQRLEDRMDEVLGWTGLGACDGGSIGSGTMEVCNFVVDFDVAKKVIAEDLAGTEFGNYLRIYREDGE